MKEKVLNVDKWETVDYPEKTVGKASIVYEKYSSGFYLMEGVGGYWLWKNDKSIKIQVLKINGETVMLDDPLHWIGMELLAKASTGRVMVAGLGLGLVVHHLVKNKKVKEIYVVEKSMDVIKLISSLLPKDKRIIIMEGDIYDEPWRSGVFNTIILDIWVKTNKKFRVAGERNESSLSQVDLTVLRIMANRPSMKILVWGVRDVKLNPATTKLPKRYMKLVEAHSLAQEGVNKDENKAV